MPSFIVKANPDEDFYVVWSTIVDAPTAAGTRAEIEAQGWIDSSAERFDRADRNGTSAMWEHVADDEQPFGWSDESFGVGEVDIPKRREDGWYELPRKHLREFVKTGNPELIEFTPEPSEPTS